MEIITDSANKTKNFATTFAKKLKPGDILALFGELGSGKTTFVQGLAEGFGITRRILSPSFVFVRVYDLGKDKKFYHVDLYRIGNEKNTCGLGLEEVFGDKKSIVVIEWAEKLGKFLPKKRIEINFEYGKEANQRKINIKRRD